MNTFEKIKAVLVKEMGNQFTNVTEETTFEELELDSLGLVHLIMAIEEEFDIEITEEDASSLKCMADAIKFVESKN